MARDDSRTQLDEAFGRIEESVLPSLSLMLDAALEAAALARPGKDAETFAAELRTLGAQLDGLTRQLEAVSLATIDSPAHRAASAA